MDLINILLLVAIFIFTVAVIEVIYLAWQESQFTEKMTIKKRLLYISAGGKHGQERLSKYREGILKDVGVYERFLLTLPRLSNLDKLLVKAKLPLNATTFIIASIALAFIGFWLGYRFLPQLSVAVALSLLFLVLPYMYLKFAEKKYFSDFNDQLPEALDLLARAMKSGHALTSGLALIAEEIDDPIKGEFAATVDEINLGLTTKEAIENLCERVPLPDLRFFAISILVQKETGGNIAEILEKISQLIRERIQFKQLVKTLTAEGRYSAGILIALPLIMFIYMYVTNYDYLSLLWKEELGQYMLFGAIIMQIIGSIVIKRIVTIEM
jgi:tight adherence protein B